MTAACIVQARLTSTRLPGKVLMRLRGDTVLRHVLDRCRMIRGIDVVVCAIPEGEASEPLAVEAEACGAQVFRGSETDVLGRYHGAARMVEADVVMRVTSDCPLIDPEVCGSLLRLQADEKADYACNNRPPSWPHGLDCEVFPAFRLAQAFREARDPFEREHVSPWIRNHPDFRWVNLPSPDARLAEHRWTLDHPEDMEFLRAVFAALPEHVRRPTTAEVLKVLAENPKLAAINRVHHPIKPTSG